MVPMVGDVVNYTNLGDKDGVYPPEQQAAVITGVQRVAGLIGAEHEESNYKVWLTVLYRTGTFLMEGVPYSEKFQRGHWTWRPERPSHGP